MTGFLLAWYINGNSDPALGVKVKVKYTLAQALRLCTGRTSHRENRGIALNFHGHGTRSGWGVSVTPWPLSTPGKEPVTIAYDAFHTYTNVKSWSGVPLGNPTVAQLVKKIMRFVWNTRVRHQNHKFPMEVNVLNHIKIWITKPYVFTVHFYIILL